MGCPYNKTLVEYWDEVCNPLGDACYHCDDYDCEHNFTNIDDYDMDESNEQKA